MSEQSIIGARASVMMYDDVQKKWIPSGSSSGLSKVQIYHHQQNNTFRVVGRKLQDHEVVINCSILKGLKYNQATATFHQWRDSKSVYGLNFSSQQDAEAFARAMKHALEVLSNRAQNGIPAMGQPGQQHVYDEDMGYRTMTREDAAIIQQQQNGAPQQQQQLQHQGPLTPTPQPGQHVPQSPPTPQGHHRTSSAPPAPQPPPMSMPGQPQYAQQSLPSQQQQQQQIYAGGYGPGNNNGVIPMSQQMPGNSNGMPYQQQQQQQPPMFASSNSQQNLQQMHQNGGGGAIYMSVGHGMAGGDNGMMSMNNGGGLPTVNNGAGGYAVGNMGPQGVVGMIPHPPAPMNFGGNGGGGPPPSATVVDAPIGHIPAPPQMPVVSSGGGGGGVPPPPPPPAFGNMNGGAPQPPQPPPAMPATIATGQVPVAPPMGVPGGPGGVPPPPPPIPMNLGGPAQMDMCSLAAQLQNAKLKRGGGGNKAPNAPPPPVENSGSSTSSGGSGNYGTIGKSTNGMASMMDEMQKTLARRRAQAEKKEPEPSPMDDCAGGRKPWEKSNTLPHKSNSNSNGSMNNSNSAGGSGSSGAESPRPSRKRFGSASEETILKQVNGDGLSLPFSAEMDNLKAEILREIRTEIQKAKQEILDVIKLEFNRR